MGIFEPDPFYTDVFGVNHKPLTKDQHDMELWFYNLEHETPPDYRDVPKEIQDEFDRSLNDDLNGLHPDDDFQELWENFCQKAESNRFDEEDRKR
jgi:hypothetical protein